MWTGGLTGLVVGGPLGAGVGVWGGRYLAKQGKASSKLARKANQWSTRIGPKLERKWQQVNAWWDEEDLIDESSNNDWYFADKYDWYDDHSSYSDDYENDNEPVSYVRWVGDDAMLAELLVIH